MAITQYDCGDVSNVVISQNAYNGNITLTSDSVNGVVSLTSTTPPIDFLCSGILDVNAPVGAVNIFLADISASALFTDNLLMGLCGIVCGYLMAAVFIKYAV